MRLRLAPDCHKDAIEESRNIHRSSVRLKIRLMWLRSRAAPCEAVLMTEIVDFPARTDLAPAADQHGTAVGAPILAAVDLGEASRAAVSWASELAERTGAPLKILHVLHDPAESPGKYARHKSDPLEPIADTAERMLSEFMVEMRVAHPGLRALTAATTKLVKGLPAQMIVDEARVLGASLIVIGCRGKSSLAKLLYGSNSQRVTQLSPIPVTVVKAPSP